MATNKGRGWWAGSAWRRAAYGLIPVLVGVASCNTEARPSVPAAAQANGKQAAKAGSRLPEGLQPFDDYHGVYLNGAKVGWMRSQLRLENGAAGPGAGPAVHFETNFQAKVRGMGQLSQVELKEQRSYALDSGELQHLLFSQTASTGQMRVEGRREGAKAPLAVTVTAGGMQRHQTVTAPGTLQDVLVSLRLAQGAKVGATATEEHFDPSLLKSATVEHRVEQLDTRLFGGVPVAAVKLVSSYPELGMKEERWLTSEGRTLESRVGGFFVARLESEREAKSMGYQQDLLVSAVVKPPQQLDHPEALERLFLRMRGFPSDMPPSSPRQKVTRDADGLVRITLSRETEPPRQPLARAGAHKGADKRASLPASVRKYLEPTAFVQSDAPSVLTAARAAIGEATDTFEAVRRLAAFVYEHVEDAYVPSYSNALEALQSARGDCTEHSVLFVALARALGIPARVAVGVAYWPPGDGFGWHAWGEVWVKDRWVAVDPTWNQPLVDATHIKLAAGGAAEQARIVMLLGNLDIEAMTPVL